MGAWKNLEVSAARVREAHRAVPFLTTGDGGAVTFIESINPKAPEAKTLVATELQSRLAVHVARFDSPEAMLDAMAVEPRLADSLQTLLAYGMIVSEQQSGSNRRHDRYEGDADVYMERLKTAARAVAGTAPYVLGLTGQTGGGGGGALASIMSRVD